MKKIIMITKGNIYNIRMVADILNIVIGSFKIGRTFLFDHLRYAKILQSGENWNKPFQEYIDNGYFVLMDVRDKHWEYKIALTSKGLNWLQNEMRQIFIEEEIAYWKEFHPTELYRLGL